MAWKTANEFRYVDANDDIEQILKHQSLYDMGYLRAAGYLQQLRESARGDTVETALKTAECELRLQRGKEEESIQRVRNVLERSGLSDADPVLKEGEKYDESDQRQRVQALILYRIANEMHLARQHKCKPEAIAEWIRRLVFDVRLASYNLADEKGMASKEIALEYGARLSKNLLNTVRRIDISQLRAEHESAICMYHIADIYFRCDDYPSSLQLLEESTALFKGLECRNEHDHERYCIALWTLGNCHYRLKDFARAEEQYKVTIAEAKKLPATEAKWLKIASEDLAKAVLQQGRDRPALETFRYGVSDDPLTERVNSSEGDDSFESLLDIASYELLLQRGREERSIERLEMKVFAGGAYTAASLLKKLENCDLRYIEQKVKALILYRIAHKLFQQERHSADDTVKWIQELVQDIQLSAYDLAAHKGTFRTVAVNHGAKHAEFLLHILLEIENAAPSRLSQAIARCLYYIANIYFRAEKYEGSLLFFLRAKLFFEGFFRESSHNVEGYYLTLWNIGNCNFRLRNFDNAEFSYRYAKSVLENRANPSIEQRWLKIVKRDHGKAASKIREAVQRRIA